MVQIYSRSIDTPMILTILKFIYQIVREVYCPHHVIGLSIENIRHFRQLIVCATQSFHIIPAEEIFQSIAILNTRDFFYFIIIQIHFHEFDFLAKRM